MSYNFEFLSISYKHMSVNKNTIFQTIPVEAFEV